ncbi:MAG: hypothetical protein WCR42_15015 [bacterium]
MKRLILILILVLSFNYSGYSQNDKLIPKALAIKIAFENLQKDSNSIELQKKYIDLFPDNEVIFKKIFASPTFDQLYMQSDSYIFKLSKIWDNDPVLIGAKLIRLCIGFKYWEADAIGYIQNISIDFANSHLPIFTKLVENLTSMEQDILITFLADVENHKAYECYQKLIDHLIEINQNDLADKFEKARTVRVKQKHD